MLSLLDPVQIDNLSLFRDDEDPRKFYVLPDDPVVVTDEQGNPDFLFIHYIRDVQEASDTATADDLAAGYVQFRTSIRLSDDRRTKLVTALRAQLQQEQQGGKKPFGHAITSTEPLLASPLWTKGTCHLETFKVGDKELVRQATTDVPVDLAGALTAALNLTLSSDGATVFWSAFESYQQQQIPILIRYDLTYQARVSADMTIHADRTTIIKQVWEGAAPQPAKFINRRWVIQPHVGVFNMAALHTLQLRDPGIQPVAKWSDVRKAVHSAVSTGAIQVNINIGAGAGGTDNKTQELLFTLATGLLTDKVVPTIFGDPLPQADDGSGDGSKPNTPDDELMKLPPISTDDKDESKFDMTFTSTQVIDQTCSPNASIHLLLQDPAKLAACFKELRIGDGFLKLLRASASTTGVNFAQDGISAVHVYFNYDEIDEANMDRPRVQRNDDGMLKSETDVVRFKVDTARDAQGRHKKRYYFRTDTYYGGGLVIKSKPTDWIPATDEVLAITPAHMGVVRVQLVLTAPREQVSRARVTLTAMTGSGAPISDKLDLTPDAPTKTWLRPLGDLVAASSRVKPAEYTYQITYVVNGNDVPMPATTSTSDGLELTGPFSKVLHFVLVPQGSFEGVTSISGTLRYTDQRTGYQVIKTYSLTSLTASMAFDIPTMDGGPDQVDVTQTINRADGSSTDLDGFSAEQGEVRVGLHVTYLEVQINAALIDFASDVQLALVQLSYSDSAIGDTSTSLTFSKANPAPQTWKVPLTDPRALDYDVDIQYIAYDRSKSSEVHTHPVKNTSAKTVLLLDRGK